MRCDVASEADGAAAVAAASQLGPLRVLVNSAGLGRPGTAELALAIGGDEEKRAHSSLRRPAFHQSRPSADRNGFPTLVDTLMLELNDAGILA